MIMIKDIEAITVNMKVLALSGGPRLIGNTSHALNYLLDELNKEGFETEYIQLYEDHMIPCNCCGSCEIRGDGRCINEDDSMNEYLDKMRVADVIILASPTYYGSCTGQMKIFLERAGYCLLVGDKGLEGKIGAAMVTQERDGGTMVYSELTNWMLRNGLIVVGSDPLPIINGLGPNDWEDDTKGIASLDGLTRRITELVTKLY